MPTKKATIKPAAEKAVKAPKAEAAVAVAAKAPEKASAKKFENGRIYVNGNDGFVYAFNVAGQLQWKLATSGFANPSMDVVGTPAIGNDGTLYVPGNDGNLYSFQ